MAVKLIQVELSEMKALRLPCQNEKCDAVLEVRSGDYTRPLGGCSHCGTSPTEAQHTVLKMLMNSIEDACEHWKGVAFQIHAP